MRALVVGEVEDRDRAAAELAPRAGGVAEDAARLTAEADVLRTALAD